MKAVKERQSNRITAKQFLLNVANGLMEEFRKSSESDDKVKPLYFMFKPFSPMILKKIESMSERDAFNFAKFLREQAEQTIRFMDTNIEENYES